MGEKRKQVVFNTDNPKEKELYEYSQSLQSFNARVKELLAYDYEQAKLRVQVVTRSISLKDYLGGKAR